MNLSIILYEEFNMFNKVHNVKYISKDDLIYLLGVDHFNLKKTPEKCNMTKNIDSYEKEILANLIKYKYYFKIFEHKNEN